MAATGCASSQRLFTNGWYADFEEAEQHRASSGQPMLIYYRSHSVRRDTPMEERLNTPALRARLDDYVPCKLFRSHEPHRRYAAQYGVLRAPALVVVHPDGTFHRMEGLASVEKVSAFLDEAQPPGDRPTYDPLLPRKRNYVWHGSIHDAEDEADTLQRPILYLLTASFSGQWDDMKKLFSQREVHVRCQDVTTCRLDSWSSDGGTVAERAEVREWPAVVIERLDGSFVSLERPASYEEICRFLDAVLTPVSSPGPASTGLPQAPNQATSG